MLNVIYSSICEDIHDDLMNRVLPRFSSEFQKKILRYRRWQDAQLSLLGRILLIKGMQQINEEFYEENLKVSTFKKPYLEKSNIRFNISHSAEMVVCGLTDISEIGIDIEKISPIEVLDFKPQMTENEWKRINDSINKERAFFEYWTEKEAVLKAQGHGLSVPLKSFEIYRKKTKLKSECYFLKEPYVDDEYICHLATNKEIRFHKIETIKIDSTILLN